MNKQSIIKKHNPKFTKVDFESVLSVGSHDFVYNCDITGFQTLYDEYLDHSNPLTIMSNHGWHSYDAHYTLADLTFDEYERVDGKWVKYPANEMPKRHFADGRVEDLLTIDDKKQHNSEVYNALRQSPHRANLGCLMLEVGGKAVRSCDIADIHCELDLLTGSVHTEYRVGEHQIVVDVVPCSETGVAIKVNSDAFASGDALIAQYDVRPSHKIEGGDLIMDSKRYLATDGGQFTIVTCLKKDKAIITVGGKGLVDAIKVNKSWQDFWQKVHIIPLDDGTADGLELERREILSLYNLALHSSGTLPPQETGLMCNSWYGKFHLEMHLWHTAWASLYGVPELTERSFDWYLTHLPQARENAARNGFVGYRWPKMVGPDAIDSPSFIAPLLIWQQSHIVYLLHLVYGVNLPAKFADLVLGTIDFMCDFVVYNEDKGAYDIVAPIQCAQEEFGAMSVYNPTFELAYWKHCIGIALDWACAEVLEGAQNTRLWEDVHSKLAVPMPVDGLYPSHANAPDTFPNFMKDHPVQLAILGMFDNLDAVLKKALKGKAVTKADFDVLLFHVFVDLMALYTKHNIVMQMHFGALRNVNSDMLSKLGPDTGYDAIGDTPNVALGIAKLLDTAKNHGGVPTMVWYSLNPNDWMSIVTVMGGFQSGKGYQSQHFGSGWWFDDTYSGMNDQITKLAEGGLLGNFIGMLTDSRSFLSWPRHEYFRRILCNHLASLVNQGRLSITVAQRTAKNVAYNNVKELLGF